MAQKKFDLMRKLRAYKRPTVAQFIVLGVGLAAAIVLFIFLQGFVACWRLTALPGVPPPTCPGLAAPVTDPQGTPIVATPTLSAPQVELPPPWDGASRVTVLLIGLDYRDWEAGSGAPRSDTMILLTVDPLSRTAGILSVPRDMWVSIPGFSYSKINNAYSFGEGYRLPGGGPGLAMKTVETFLGVPIQYFAQVDFVAFEQMVDRIGGVCLTIPEQIRVGRTYEASALLEPGYQCLDGKSTLGYARARNTDGGDVDRSKRQQEVIFALRDKVLNPANFPTLIRQAPALYNELSSGINTNMSLDDALRLAVLVQDIPRDSIQHGVIDFTMVGLGTVEVNGQTLDIFRPVPDRIRELVDRIFGGGAMKPMAEGEATVLMQEEGARVVVINGSGVAGLASATADYLTAQGMNVVGFGNTTDYPDQYNRPFPERTILIVHSGRPYAMKYLMSLMGFNSNSQIIVDIDPEAPADIVIGLGADWGSSNPLP